MKKTVMIVLALSVAVVLSDPVFAGTDETPVLPEFSGGEDLLKEKGSFRETWIRPDADFSRYDKVYLWEALFDFREAEEARRSNLTSSNLKEGGQFGVRDESKKKFEAIVNEAVVAELGRSKTFEVVERVGPETLIVRPAMLDIVSNVPPSYTGMAKIYLSAVGEATILFELIDAETGVIQARIGERRRIQPPGRKFEVSSVPANASTVWMDVERWAREVGRDLRRVLEKTRK